MTKYNYILTIEPITFYNTKELKKILDIAIDWLQIMPNVFLLVSTSTTDMWHDRIKPIIKENNYFIAEVNIDSGSCQGWLPASKWDWIKEKR